ncbi:MAG: type I 3-dehydroquinate dehydratase, partial [Nitrosopumilaceae archaeon]
MKYKTCVSIAETNPKKLKQILKTGLKKSDFVELRFDFLKPEQIPFVLQNARKDLKKIVCTLRPKAEGGKFNGTEKETIASINSSHCRDASIESKYAFPKNGKLGNSKIGADLTALYDLYKSGETLSSDELFQISNDGTKVLIEISSTNI